MRKMSLAAVVFAALLAPRFDAPAAEPAAGVSPDALKALQYRSLGFSRGGRSTAVAGVASKPLVYYFGSTGGGVWKTTDGGIRWQNVSDGAFEAGSIGAIAVAETDPNVVYVGTGSACPRGNISPGVGLYRSTDAGKTWKHAGIREAGQIGRIAIHPKDPNLVYIAALGHIFGPNDERGVFRSRDGGKTWEKALFVSSRTGAVDLSMDPTNPRVLYAAMWTADRKPWNFTSGGEESGLYKTTDGGDTWTKLKGGLPEGVVGKIGVAVSPANPERVWALVEAAGDKAGVYRSDNAGQSWRKLNGERRFVQRAWYYIHIYADPADADTVYVLNTGFYRSSDGGRTYESLATPHGDNHDLWINPNDPKTMINANDGGANVSRTGGTSWSTQSNQPTAEFYRVTVDTQFPYRVYGAQQDNSTASVPSRSDFREDQSFYSVGGGESGHIAVDPRNPSVVYAGSYGGTISRLDLATRQSRGVRAYPESSTGQRASDMKYRFQWNAPIRISLHDPDVVYHTSQHVHRTRDAGHSWEVISPDLTRADKTKLDYAGGPISRDNTGVEVFGTIFAFEESPRQRGVLWAGSDDGLVHVSRDNGANWKNVTPPGMPDFGTVNMIDPSAHDPGRALVAVYRYRQDDFKPYIFRTNDYGATWQSLDGIPANHFVRVVREDPDRKGLLYAGTEFGMFMSFDDGASWQRFQLNLPITPVTDLLVYRKDLVVATQGRAFWILDDLTPVHQIAEIAAAGKPALMRPRQAYRMRGAGAAVHYYLPQESKETLQLEILDASGAAVQTFSSRAEQATAEGRAETEEETPRFGRAQERRLPARAGINRFTWNLSYPSLFTIPPRIVMWGGGGAAGPAVVPGTYQLRLKIGDWSQTQPLEVLNDPRSSATQAELVEQLTLARAVGGKVKEIYDAILKMRDVRKQATDLGARLKQAGHGDDAARSAKALSDALTAIEGDLTQLQGEGGQDALNFPGRLDNQFVALYSEVVAPYGRPSAGALRRFEDLKPELAKIQARLKQALDRDLAAFNKLVRDKNLPPVIVPSEPKPAPRSSSN